MEFKATSIILAVLMIFAGVPAPAREQRCQAPPYGASMEAYNVFVAGAPPSDKAESSGSVSLSRKVAEVLARICEMKYGTGDRTELYRAGFTQEDIDHSSTVVLTAEYLGVIKYRASQVRAQEQQGSATAERGRSQAQGALSTQSAPPAQGALSAQSAPPAQGALSAQSAPSAQGVSSAQSAAPAQSASLAPNLSARGLSPADYSPLTVADFAANGSNLAAANAKVSLTGAYLRQGDREVLYTDVQAIIKNKYASQTTTAPTVPLLTHTASTQFRRRALACQTDPSAAEVGCMIKIHGTATMCKPTNASGDVHEVPCVSVEDGR